MPDAPYTYDVLNRCNAPNMLSFVHIAATGMARYFKRYLLQEALSVFEYTLPAGWDADYFRYVLLGFGYICIMPTDDYGVIPQHCTLSGRNVFYRPTRALVANPLIQGGRDLLIGRDCAIIKLMPDYGSISDIVDNYGNMLALAYETAAVNMLNSKVSYVFPVANKTEADSMKAMFDEITSGSPAVFPRKAGGTGAQMDTWKPFTQNVGQNFITPEVLETMRTVRDMFLTDIGIPNLTVRKKERTNLYETEKNDIETQCKVMLWLEEQRGGIEEAIRMFPDALNAGNFSVKLRFGEVERSAG